MTTEEFSNEFDVLVNSYFTSPEVGITDPIAFNEYEKSVFLTKAQQDLVLELYNGKNAYNDSFENTEEIRRYLSSLVKTYTTSTKKTGKKVLSDKSVLFQLPNDLWFITYESVTFEDESLGCANGTQALVVPTTQDEFYRTNKNPFRGSNKRRVLRLDIESNIVELVSKYNIGTYLVRYVAKLNPIILVNLPDDMSIDNVSSKSECLLESSLHTTILERAVRQALLSKSITINKAQ